jgi:hypothetical protein
MAVAPKPAEPASKPPEDVAGKTQFEDNEWSDMDSDNDDEAPDLRMPDDTELAEAEFKKVYKNWRRCVLVALCYAAHVRVNC